MMSCPFSGNASAGTKCPITGASSTTEATNDSSIDACPVIHAVNEEEVQQVKQEKKEYASEEAQQEEQDVTEDATDHSVTKALEALMKESDEKSEIPSIAEYQKLRRTTAIITGFYAKGTEAKREQYENVKESLSRLYGDEEQCKAQIAALQKYEKFKGHLKYKEYMENYQDELSNLQAQKTKLEETAKHYYDLHIWSQEIVKICEWLEQHLDYYAYKTIPELPIDKIFKGVTPQAPPELNDEEKFKYSKGLDEICHNLNESRDFFEASVDGRLNRYQEIEREIILCQLESLAQSPAENNPRREYIESELRQDLAHVESQLKDSERPETQKRRQFMLKMHKEFIDVLSFFRETLGVLNDSNVPKKYDERYTSKFTLPADE
ncbi:hypothetical protein C9374_002364 [Naegleria lovaniensis]|uniref:Uncharacterized protein n=1 Tax=Naegleria lovaniensis TaxID=51637 RepID=A0AA88KKB7_NAELO|nr:uncharacterized protein C9374_002364 [Naegleria lovaniensis]KAG2386620.1 hypothetical protein C9374_002364 [Naegleria lovaniensis]